MGRTFDAYLEELGSFGRYQKLRFYGFCVPAVIVATFCMFTPIFWLEDVDHRCAFPMYSDDPFNDTLVWKFYSPYNRTRPAAGDHIAHCEMYDPPCDIFESRCRTTLLEERMNDAWTTYPCRYGYKYTAPRSGLVEKFNMVCEKHWVVGLILSLTAAGQIFSSIFGTMLADNLGRKRTFFLSLTWYIATNTVLIFMPDWISFSVVIFLRGLSGSVNFQVLWVYSLELAPSSKHALVTFFIMASWAVFAMILAGIAWLTQTWVQLLCIATYPAALFYLAFPVIHESPRWLMATKRYDEAKLVMEKIAKTNDVHIDLNELHTLIDEEASILANSQDAQREAEEGGKIKGMWSLFASKDLALKTLATVFIWAVDHTVYEGMMIMVGDIGSNHYVTFALLAGVEVLSDIVIYITADRIGRISPMAFSTALGGLVCIGAVMVPKSMHALTVTLAIAAKFFNTLSFDFLFLVGAEIFPTVVRGSGVAFCSAVANIVYTPVPFIVVASKRLPWIPMSIFGGLSVVAGAVAFLLPETANHHMVDQMSQSAEQPMGKKALRENLMCKSLKARNTPL